MSFSINDIAQAFCDNLSWIFIILGWYIVHIASLSRERRKENREITNSIIQEIRVIENISIEFHQSKRFDQKMYEEITLKLNRIIHTLQRFPLNKLKTPTSQLTQLRQAITLNNFDKTSFCRQTHESYIIQNIRAVTDDLIEKIEDARNNIFR